MKTTFTTFSTPAYDYRLALLLERGLTPRAASIVLNAAMYGIGCTEGKVRAEIEAQKKKPLSGREGLVIY